jgi:hypothetical protein
MALTPVSPTTQGVCGMMQWSAVSDSGAYHAVWGIDPRAEWLLGPGLPDFLPGGEKQPFPFILRVESVETAEYFNALVAAQRVFIPQFEAGDPKPLEPGDIVTAFADKAFFQQLAEHEASTAPLLKQIQFSLPMPDPLLRLGWMPGMAAPRVRPLNVMPRLRPWGPGTVIMAIIDDGIAFAHERFRRAPHETRIEYFWRQEGERLPDGSAPYGQEWTKEEIDALLLKHAGGEEEAIYREAGLLDYRRPTPKPLALRLTHGTHVLDLAAGESLAQARDDRPIIAVQLPTAATADASGANLEHAVEDALYYIRARARLLAGSGPALPVVVNFSYATQTGPHDGTSPLETLIDRLVLEEKMPMRIVLPAGNGHAARCHAEADFQTGELVDLPWRVQPDDQTPSTVQIWMPHVGDLAPTASRMEFSIVTPAGEESLWLGEQPGAWMALRDRGEIICRADYKFMPLPTARGVFTVTLEPTARLLPAEPVAPGIEVAPHGVWRLRMRNLSLTGPDWPKLWIARDDVVLGYPRRGRQSYFDHDGYVRFDAQGRPVEADPQPPICPVRRTHMMNGLGTGQQCLMAGGFVHSAYRVAAYSAGGPAVPNAKHLRGSPIPLKPAAALVSEDTSVHQGVLAAGTRSGVCLPMGGTSVAAPRLARWVADQLAQSGQGGHDDVANQAKQEEAKLPKALPPAAPHRAGWGRISSFPPEVGEGRRYWS